MNPASLLASADLLSAQRALPHWRSLMLVVLEQLAASNLPPEVRPALDIASTYWASEGGDPVHLSEAKVMVWGYLDAFPPGQDLATPAGRRARALLCVLEPTGDAEAAGTTAEWLVDMLREP